MAECVICCIEISDISTDTVCLGENGLSTVVQFAEQYNDDSLFNHIASSDGPVYAHISCCKNYMDKKRLLIAIANKVHPTEKSPKKLRASASAFDFKSHCFFCCEPAIQD